MFKKLVVLTTFLILMLVTSVDAGIWTTLGSLKLKEVKPNKTYALDVIGLNVRVYEFDTQEEPINHCILIFTESEYKAPVMQCWPKRKLTK